MHPPTAALTVSASHLTRLQQQFAWIGLKPTPAQASDIVLGLIFIVVMAFIIRGIRRLA
jgi:hypothetical protein